jgi:hypothetical protein
MVLPFLFGYLQLIATEPKLQISTVKTKYLVSSFFEILINISQLLEALKEL